MDNIYHYYREHICHDGIPWCDFKLYRKKRDLKEIYMQALRRLILLNKQNRSMIMVRKEFQRDITGLKNKKKIVDVPLEFMINIEKDFFEHFE